MLKNIYKSEFLGVSEEMLMILWRGKELLVQQDVLLGLRILFT
jgi:hypothetical protein